MTNRMLLLGGLVLALGSSSWAGEPAEKSAAGADDPLRLYPAAMKSTSSWLALVDHGKYGESWDAAAKIFRAASTRDQWRSGLAAARNPLGKVLSRKVKGAEHKTSLPGAPDGDYVVIRFETSFAKKKDAVETVTPMREADGSWKVAGYFIR
jgi:hypothetical protein